MRKKEISDISADLENIRNEINILRSEAERCRDLTGACRETAPYSDVDKIILSLEETVRRISAAVEHIEKTVK